jgi:hypothetical protein
MNYFEKIKSIGFYKSLILALSSKGLLKWLSDKNFLKLRFYCETGYKLDLNDPLSFNEKMQWLKLYDHNQDYINYVDKIEARKIIAEKIGEEYLVPVLGIYNSIEDINFDKLPDRFVLKCTHDSGGVVICNDKNNFDIRKAKKKLEKFLRRNFYHYGREWPYKHITPRIICEEFIEDEVSNELRDYKLMCFNGEVKCSFVCLNRNTPSGLNVDFYDLDWNRMPLERRYPNSGKVVNKPFNYNKMIEISEVLSKDLPFIRVDFYEVNNKLYVGELTLYPGSGFEEFTPVSYDYLLGSWIKLPINIK